ncbi:HK97 family phage prohead protease [Massilia sp. DD77]|uniref:HK97 family phage prohead protease n=1 Tax=Massilia sp. DD77 TaxID=3109349 RepID=UPI003000B7FB
MPVKVLPLEAVQLKLDDGAAGSFVGYASTFGNVDSYGDTILKGAYEATLKQYGMPKMFFNHDKYAVPIGKWISAVEDDYGLLMTGEFTPGNTMAEQLRAALKHGTVEGISIGYVLTKDDYQETPTGRIITKVSRLIESSLVTFPADSFAKVDLASVKSCADEIAQVATIREFETLLRDVGGFSKAAAQALSARAKTLFTARDAGDQGEERFKTEVLARLERMAS